VSVKISSLRFPRVVTW